MADIIQVKNLNLHFGDKHALKNVNLTIPANKIVALIGPSGCGKSTLLRCLNRMHDLNPSVKIEGEILFNGQSILKEEVNAVMIRKQIGMVFQKPNPFPKSIFENIAYGLEINGVNDRKQIELKVENSLKDAYIWEETKDTLQKSALQLSGGQQQRLCIARTIAVEPDVILMDEPCSALDPISTASIEKLMLKLKEKFTIVVVTHNMQQAIRVSDYTAFMYLGELIEYGETKQIFEQPLHELTRNYVNGNFG